MSVYPASARWCLPVLRSTFSAKSFWSYSKIKGDGHVTLKGIQYKHTRGWTPVDIYNILQYFYSLSTSLFVLSVHVFTCAKGTSLFSSLLFFSGCVLVSEPGGEFGANSGGEESDFQSSVSLPSQCLSFVVSGALWRLLFALWLFCGWIRVAFETLCFLAVPLL